MKNIKLWLPLVLSLMGLAIAVYVLFSDGAGDLLQSGDFRIDPKEQVTKLTLSDQQGNMVQIENTGEGLWVLNNIGPANMAAMRDILSTLQRMDVRRPVPLERKDEVMEQLSNEGVVVEVFATSHWISLPGDIRLWPRQKKIRTFFVGRNTGDGEATYMLLMNAGRPVEIYLPGVSGGIKEVFVPKEHLWRDPVVLRLPPGQIKNIRLLWPDNRQGSFEIKHDADEGYRIKNHLGEPLERSAICPERLERYVTTFSKLYHERLIPGSGTNPPRDMVSVDGPFLEIVVTDIDGNETLMQFFRRYPPGDGSLVSSRRDHDPNRFYLRKDRGDYALAQYFVFQPVMRPLSWFLTENDQSIKKNQINQENLSES